MKTRYGKGSVVVITGATNATGFAYAERFVKEGFKLICIVEHDEAEAQRLKELYPGSCEIMQFDFAGTSDYHDYVQLCNLVEVKAKEIGGDISVLVNNVERMDPRQGKIYKATDEELIQTVNINTCPAVYMSRLLGPKMKERSEKSAIITMSSYYSKWPVYNLPVYSAGKAFTEYFSEVVSIENPDMDILTVMGMPVRSKRNPNGV